MDGGKREELSDRVILVVAKVLGRVGERAARLELPNGKIIYGSCGAKLAEGGMEVPGEGEEVVVEMVPYDMSRGKILGRL
jgi:translation initiation factor IF-1